MINLRTAILIFMPAALMAQTNDWSIVERLTPGTPVLIKISRHRNAHRCEVNAVTDDVILCQDTNNWQNPPAVFVRSEVREVLVRRLHRNWKMALIGGLIGAAVAGTIAASQDLQSNDAETRVYGPAFGILMGATLGGGIGSGLGQRYQVLYRKP